MDRRTSENTRRIYVDLDGTLIATDLLWESLRGLIRTRFLALLLLPVWAFRGRAFLKRQLANCVFLNPSTLPFRKDVLDYLRQRKNEGDTLVLATAADERLAGRIADYLQLFDSVIASDGKTNCKGVRKLRLVRQHSGSAAFDYVGDSAADLPLFAAAEKAIVVYPTPRTLKRVRGVCSPDYVFQTSSVRLRDFAALIRVHQWSKNFLLAVPLLTSHRVGDFVRIFHCGLGFLALCLMASSGYIINDFLDLAADRIHPNKRSRPLASGRIRISSALTTSAILFIAAVGMSLMLPAPFTVLLVVYLVTSLAYSLYIKRKLLLDVICLAGLYTYRILLGGVTVAVVLSPWLLAFSMFLFLSLAFLKRYAEFSRNGGSAEQLSGRGYVASDVTLVGTVGPSCGLVCVLVFCLYINSPDAAKLYHNPILLWLICPVLLYWITRMWFVACRQEIFDDPVLFAMRDRTSLLALSIMGLLAIAASL